MLEVCYDLESAEVRNRPFPYFIKDQVLPPTTAEILYHWLENTNAWKLTETDFYTQYEFSLEGMTLPADLKFLTAVSTLEYVERQFIREFGINGLNLVDVVAHKLIDGHRIGVHNDFINGEETHRMVLHVNPTWKEENGGFLLLFNSNQAEDLSQVIKPIDNTVFGFEISKNSHHAVSKIFNYTRYTIVYTFKQVQ